jgi:hypothetical protein
MSADMLNTTAAHGAAAAASNVGLADDHLAVARQADFFKGVMALLGVVLSSAFGFLYLEWQLKLHAQDPLFVQLHHMNSFAAAVSLVIHFRNATLGSFPTAGEVAVANAGFAANLSSLTGGLNTSVATGSFTDGIPQVDEDTSILSLPTFTLVACILTRGFLSGSVLKQLDAIAKGLIDVTAIVLCTGLQVSFGGLAIDRTAIGIQGLMLLSIISYIIARAPTWSVAGTGAEKAAKL